MQGPEGDPCRVDLIPSFNFLSSSLKVPFSPDFFSAFYPQAACLYWLFPPHSVIPPFVTWQPLTRKTSWSVQTDRPICALLATRLCPI